MQLSADPLKRSLFVESAVAILEKEGFDGLDVDWEYPTYRGGLPQDRVGAIGSKSRVTSTKSPIYTNISRLYQVIVSEEY